MRRLLQNKKSMMIKFAIVFGVIVGSVLLMKKKDMSYRPVSYTHLTLPTKRIV